MKDTLACLESVYEQDFSDYEVVVVDNGSSDDSVEVIRREFPQVIMIENKKNLGYTGGNNVGMRYAIENNADYVWLLNNDTVVMKDTLKKLVMIGNKAHKIGLVSPVIYYYDFPEKIQFAGWIMDWKNHGVEEPDYNQVGKENYVMDGRDICLWGTALLIKTDVIRKIGYLEDKYFAYWEDIDYSIRSIKAGFINSVEFDTGIYHKVQPYKKPHYYYFMARNEYMLWIKNLRLLEKISFSRKYFAKKISQYGYLQSHGDEECANAVLDGTWSGVLDIKGGWDKNVKAPYILKNILSRHTSCWVRLLGGNYSNIHSAILRELKIGIFKIKNKISIIR